MRKLHAVALVFTIGLLATLQAQPQNASPGQHVAITPDAMKWEPAPPGLPPGAKVAVLEGDPSKPGELFILRAKMPDGYTVPPHWHPMTEHLVVLQGTLMIGVGEKFDREATHPLKAGGYSKMPKEIRHFVWTKGETIFDVSGLGPFDITYVDPSDDPRKKTTSPE